MQLIESTPFGVRSARLHLESRHSPVTVTLFPMIHIGDAAFYETVYGDALAHDFVLYEGVAGRVTKLVTRSYRWMASAKTLQLVIQPKMPAGGAAQRVHADLSGEAFEAEWRKAAWWLRWLIYAAAPFMGLRHRALTREELARHIGSTEDILDRDDILSWTPENGYLMSALLDARDRHLTDILIRHVEASTEPTRIAVVFGAAHMRAVIRALSERLDYFCTRSEWLTVFTPDLPGQDGAPLDEDAFDSSATYR